MADAVTPSASALSLIAALHRAHETRLDRVAAVRRARVAFVGPELPEQHAEAMVDRCGGRVVALSDRPDLIVVPGAGHVVPALQIRGAARVVDTREFVAMHRAVVEAGDVSMLRLAVRSARLRLEEAVRIGGHRRAATTPTGPETRSSRMRTGSDVQAATRVDAARAAAGEALAQRIVDVVQDLRAADPEARLYRR